MRILRNLSEHNNPLPNDTGRYHFDKHSWPFKLEKEWEYVNHLKDADIVPIIYDGGATLPSSILRKMNLNQTALLMAIYHVGESQTEDHFVKELEKYRKIFPNVIIVHKNRAINDTDYLVHYDSMFNREKLYFTDYHRLEQIRDDTGVKDVIWTPWMTRDIYNLPQFKKNWGTDFKSFLSPNLVYEGMFVPRMRYRAGLQDYLKKHLPENSFRTTMDNLFLPNNPSPALLKFLRDPKVQGGFWFPVADEYYYNSTVSVYVETLTISKFNTRCVTEKTFDPLIKGNFIMPFAYKGFLNDVKSYGFKLPNFIDYGYDEESDDTIRFDRFLYSIFRVGTKIDLREQYEKNIGILKHNRQIFFDRPYDTLYDKIRIRVEARPVYTPTPFRSAI